MTINSEAETQIQFPSQLSVLTTAHGAFTFINECASRTTYPFLRPSANIFCIILSKTGIVFTSSVLLGMPDTHERHARYCYMNGNFVNNI